ncbi:YciI family protein [Nonomuraea sp. NPDC050310]|uniref:YciI family protein n=1 Tax=Nonomuraea sp. NPDC050310 TaxID=3154935 RepID=UPI0033D715E6
MRFALLLFDTEGYWEAVSPQEMEAALAEHAAFAEYLRAKGVTFSGEALHPSKEARSLRPSKDGVVAADGPFVALREELAGFYLVDCAGVEKAEQIARRCPLGAGIEIRPVWEGQ